MATAGSASTTDGPVSALNSVTAALPHSGENYKKSEILHYCHWSVYRLAAVGAVWRIKDFPNPQGAKTLFVCSLELPGFTGVSERWRSMRRVYVYDS